MEYSANSERRGRELRAPNARSLQRDLRLRRSFELKLDDELYAVSLKWFRNKPMYLSATFVIDPVCCGKVAANNTIMLLRILTANQAVLIITIMIIIIIIIIVFNPGDDLYYLG